MTNPSPSSCDASQPPTRASPANSQTTSVDLPLALEQAAAYMEETGNTATRYRELYRSHQTALLAKGAGGPDYPESVATTWALNVQAITAVPGARDLLRLCAYLAPEGIPRGLFRDQVAALPERLAAVVADPSRVQRGRRGAPTLLAHPG